MHGNEAKSHPKKSDCLYYGLILKKIYDCLHRSFFSCLKKSVDIEKNKRSRAECHTEEEI